MSFTRATSSFGSSLASSAARLRDARIAERDRTLVGLDVSPEGRRGRSLVRIVAPLLALAILASLGMAVLRTDVLRSGYALTEAHREEQRLREQLRTLTVSMRELRDPSTLQTRAGEMGFARPERVLELGATAVQRATPARAAASPAGPVPPSPASTGAAVTGTGTRP